MELRLAVEHDGRRDLERQRQLGAGGRHAHRQAGGAGSLGRLLDRLDLLLVERVGDVGQPLPAAVDLPLADLALDPVERGGRGCGVGGGRVGVVALADLRQLRLLQRARLRGREAGRPAGDPTALDHRDARAVALAQQRGRDAGDPAADHGDVDGQLLRRLLGGAAAGRERRGRRARSSHERTPCSCPIPVSPFATPTFQLPLGGGELLPHPALSRHAQRPERSGDRRVDRRRRRDRPGGGETAARVGGANRPAGRAGAAGADAHSKRRSASSTASSRSSSAQTRLSAASASATSTTVSSSFCRATHRRNSAK